MRLRSGYVVAVLCTLIALTVFAFAAAAAAENQRAEDEGASRWQHLALTHDSADIKNRELSQKINRLGDEGWELINVSTFVKDGTTVKTVFFFKRPK